MKTHWNISRLAIMVAAGIGLGSHAAVAQNSANIPILPKAELQSRVDQIMNRIHARAYTATNGVTRIAYAPPTTSDFEEIEKLGPQAITALSVYLDDKGDFNQLTAVKFLGALGSSSSDVIAPLQHAAAAPEDKWVVVRLAAMDALARTKAPNGATTIMQMMTDTDPLVSQRVLRLLTLSSSFASSPLGGDGCWRESPILSSGEG